MKGEGDLKYKRKVNFCSNLFDLLNGYANKQKIGKETIISIVRTECMTKVLFCQSIDSAKYNLRRHAFGRGVLKHRDSL